MFRASTACTFLTESVSFHNCRHVLGISTSKSCPRASVFNRFDSRMCFAPQLHALFEHLNFQKCSEAEVLCAVWLQNVLHAITACNFWSLISPDGSALASLLFDPPEPQNIKAQCFAAFLPFRTHLVLLSYYPFLFPDLLPSFSSLTLLTSIAASVHVSEVWLLNFLR